MPSSKTLMNSEFQMVKHVSKQKSYMLILENLENTGKQKEKENLKSHALSPRQSLFFSVLFHMVELMQHVQKLPRDAQMEDAM